MFVVWFVGMFEWCNGFIDNGLGGFVFNSIDSFFVCGSVLWEFVEFFNVNLIVYFGKDILNGIFFKLGVIFVLGGSINFNEFVIFNMFGDFSFVDEDGLGIDCDFWDIIVIVDW